MRLPLGKDPRESNEIHDLLLEVINHLDAMVAYWDSNRVCVFANSAYLEWMGKTKQEMVGITMQELLGPLYSQNLPYIDATLAGERQVFEREIAAPDGRIRHSLATYIPHFVDGQVRGMFVHVADVTPLKNLEHDLRAAKTEAERLATHDFLTGLPNRVLLMDRIQQALSLASRKRRQAAIFSVDIDNFKKVNDTYGHPAGDQFLVEIATRLKGLLREGDSVTRMGGDEFIVLVREIETLEQAKALAQRIVDSLRAPLRIADDVVVCSCSVGVALSSRDGMSPDALIANSDKAAYRAKRLGKNRYAFAASDDAI